ncbi:UNVERIFIED_CONTAM: hypothetical protein Cloal_0783 [Acetivibrio alkalicellulosi]
MLVNKLFIMLCTCILMISLKMLNVNTILSVIITIVIVMSLYMFIFITRSKKRVYLLETNCNPKAFLDETDKQISMVGKDKKMNGYLNIEKSAGLIELGNFNEAKDILLSIDKKILSKKYGTYQVYYINLIVCLYELGEIEEAEEIYKEEIDHLNHKNSTITIALKVLEAERLFFTENYSESKNKFNELLDQQTTPRTHLAILFRLGKIDEKTGDINGAKEKYMEVAKNGNKLWIAQQAREFLASS